MAKTAFVFPGQGSQKVGMGQDWAEGWSEARDVFAEADDVLGFALSTLCWEGPEEDLRLTANTQPALLTVSTAVHRVVARDREAGPGKFEAAAVAGHSLGEYSALVAAGVLTFADALRLVRRRGEQMQLAVPAGEGTMAAILGLDGDALAAITGEAAGDQVCSVANYNAPGQIVIAGHRAAVERAVELAKPAGAKKAVMLPVSAPFHCSLMAPAREAMAEALAATEFRDPSVPVVTNVDARPVTSGAQARDALVRQIDSPVRWVESIETMVGELGVGRFCELGPGKVLCGMIRRIARGSSQVAIGEAEAYRALEA
ncbi:MAG: ACP S-malonyltransferase [Acidobacteriota bacterium]